MHYAYTTVVNVNCFSNVFTMWL